jgi:cystathionine beta-lyase/cystathionine gamma-synthase
VKTVYGPAQNFMSTWLPKFGVETTFVDGTDVAEFEAALRPNTTLFYLESPSSSIFKLQDLPAVTALAKSRGIRTIIDNSYCTMLLQRPLDLGVDLSVYSATKYLNGHSDVVAGAVVGRRELISAINKTEFQLLGGIIGPFEAWLIARGLRTLPTRMRQHQASAAAVVEYLVKHPRVKQVYYPGHPSHPQYELACRQMKGASSLLSFEMDTRALESVKRFVNAVRFIGLGVSWGGHESLMFAPLIAQSRELPPDRWQSPGMVRLHVGLEDPQDLIEDLDQALAQL